MKLELLEPYLNHLERCAKWRSGWWDDAKDCDCGLEEALLKVDEYLLDDLLPDGGADMETIGF